MSSSNQVSELIFTGREIDNYKFRVVEARILERLDYPFEIECICYYEGISNEPNERTGVSNLIDRNIRLYLNDPSYTNNNSGERIFVYRGYGVDNHIAAHGFGVIHKDIQSGFDPRADQLGSETKDFFNRGRNSGIQGGNDGGHDSAVDLFFPDIVDFQDIFYIYGVFQACFNMVGGNALEEVGLLGIDSANDNIGVAHINS